jgi:hypothetical protein
MKMPRIWAGALACAFFCMLAGGARATTYYVDASGGIDGNDGLSAASAWKTIAKVNGATLAAGDQVLFKRGETWNESLVPPASGMSGSPISFDAYGTGEAPTITGALNLPDVAWTQDSTYVWKATVPATGMNYVLFKGSVWGLKHTTSKAECVAPYDFFFYSNTLYVYATADPATYYGSVAAMLMTNGQMVWIANRSWINLQHLKLSYYDGYGVRISGTSDHIKVANVSADGIIPAGSLPLGFYVNASPSPTDVGFYDVDAHRNYDGFKFDGTAAGIQVKNCRAYANRNKGLEDNTGGATYSYCQFYGNGVGVLLSTDVTGGTDGGNNFGTSSATQYVWPAIGGFQRYASRMSLTIDDPGLVAGEDAYVDSMLPVFDTRGLKMSVAVVAGYASSIVGKIQSWLADGQDINSHSWSHQYYVNLNAFTLQYKGTGTAATATISGNRLTTAVTGGTGGEGLDLDLTNASYDTISELVATINGRGVYAATQDVSCQGVVHTIGLADVAAQNIKDSAYTVLLEKDRLVPDEQNTSKAWLQTNISGLPNVKVYVYPSGYEDSQTQGWAVAAGYEGARGGLSMGNSLKDVESWGVNVQDITSLGISGFHNLTQQQIADQVRALVFKGSVWGVPYGLFFHNNELTTAEVGYVLDALTQNGVTVMTNTQMVDWVYGQSRVDSGTTYVSAASGPEVDWRPTPASPVVNAGADLGAVYKYDLEGADQSWMGTGWEMGAYAYVPASPFVVVVR